MATPAKPVMQIPRALTIAGSDSGGGAGIQADLKTFFALGCHGMSAVTALTAQNTVGVSGIYEVPGEFVIAQIDAVASDIGVDAAKTGMLASAPIVDAVAKALEVHAIDRIVVDPVFVSKSRDRLLATDAIDALKTRLLPLATVVTPNLFEAEELVGERVSTVADMEEAAQALQRLGPQTVLIKGGHLEGTGDAIDVFFDGKETARLVGPRIDTEDTHGTGCTLAAAIAAHLALGNDIRSAVEEAKRFVSGAIESSLRIGEGFGPVNQGWSPRA